MAKRLLRDFGSKMGTIYPKKIQDTLHGVGEKKIQVGYDKKEIRRAEGETWTDELGKECEMKSGIVMSIPKFSDIRVPLFCPECKRVMGKSAKDTEVYNKFGFCLQCLINRDIEMQRQGTFKSYAEKYQMSKQKGYYEEAKIEVTEYLEKLDRGNLEFPNEDGTMEKWTGDQEKLREFWQKELEFINEQLDKIYEKLGEMEELKVGEV